MGFPSCAFLRACEPTSTVRTCHTCRIRKFTGIVLPLRTSFRARRTGCCCFLSVELRRRVLKYCMYSTSYLPSNIRFGFKACMMAKPGTPSTLRHRPKTGAPKLSLGSTGNLSSTVYHTNKSDISHLVLQSQSFSGIFANPIRCEAATRLHGVLTSWLCLFSAFSLCPITY